MKRNMQRILLIILLCSTYHFSHIQAQETDLMREMVENDFQIRQKPNTEKLLADYLKNVRSANDTIYAILYIPAQCPRCEAYIPNFYKILKAADKKNNTLLITAYNDSIAAADYNKRSRYYADYYLYDTTDAFNNIFNFNSNGVLGLYILKLCKSKGELITGGESTFLDTEFVKQLMDCKERIEPKIYGIVNNDDDDWTPRRPDADVLKCKTEDFKMIVGDRPISSSCEVPKFENNHFFYNDVLQNGIMLFDIDGKNLKYRTLLEADSLEKRHFVEIPEDTYQAMIENQMVFYIPCGATMIDKDHVGIAYSLPHITIDTRNNPTGEKTAYYNSPAVLIRNINTLEKQEMIEPEFEVQTDSFFYKHFSFSTFENKLIFGCQKLTWPMEYERNEYENDISRNSFDDRFYDTDNPFMAAFGMRDGRLKNRFGGMEECNRKSRTGYFYMDPISYSTKDALLYADGYSGKIYVTQDIAGNNPACYTAFDVDIDQFPKLDTTQFYKREYVKPYNRFFDRQIFTAKMNKKYIYCLVRYCKPLVEESKNTKTYTLVKINRNTSEREEYKLPVARDMEPLEYGLRDDNGKISPFCFYKKGNEHIVRVFKL